MLEPINRAIANPNFPNIILLINLFVIVIFFMMYFHHHVYLVVGVLSKDKKYPIAKKNHKYAYIICARNEEKVIGNLIDSIYAQDYPRELMQVFVIADNCDDNTAKVASEHGAICYERFNQEKKGKSYALNEVLRRVLKDYSDEEYEAFIVFDADNLVTKNFTIEMNKAFDAGNRICTSFRNSKNFGKNWISAGASFMFYREGRIVHRARKTMGLGTYISGTGFLVDADIIKNEDGWKCRTMIEDIEFSIVMNLKDEKVSYVYDAEFYDEQPTKFKMFWNQGMRWYKGIHQCCHRYNGKLFKKAFSKLDMTSYDLGTHVFPFPMILFFWSVFLLISNGIYTLAVGETFQYYLSIAIIPFIQGVLVTYIYGVATCLILAVILWKKIAAKGWQKIIYSFTFPIYIYFYVIIAAVSLFKTVDWIPIEHNDNITIDEINQMKEEASRNKAA